jgi:hypothetical protein
MTSKKNLLIAAMCGLALTACGGGGGGGGGSSSGDNSTTQGSDPVTLDASNAQGTSESAVNSGGSLLYDGSGSLDYVTAAADTGGPDGLKEAIDAIREDVVEATSTAMAGVSTAASAACQGGGSFSASVTPDLTGKSTIPAGTEVSLAYSNCANVGSVIDGSVTVTFNNSVASPGSTTPDNWSASLTMSVDHFTVSQNGDLVSSVDGDLTLEVVIDGGGDDTSGEINWPGSIGASPDVYIYTLSGGSLETSDGSVTTTLTDFDIKYAVAKAGSGDIYWYWEPSYTVSSSDIGGQVTVSAETPFLWVVDSGGSISSVTDGLILISGANGTKARLSAVSGTTTVKLEVDKDGDGTFETTVTNSGAWANYVN